MKGKGVSNRGYLYGLLAALTYGSITTLGRFALDSVSPLVVATVGYAVGAAIFLPFRKKSPFENGVARLVVAAGFFGSFLGPLLFFTGLSMTTAGSAALLANAEAIFTSLIAIALFGERLSKKQAVASMAVVGGIAVVSTNLDAHLATLNTNLEGNLLVLLGTLMWGIDNNLSRIASQKLDPILLTKYKNGLGAICLTAVLYTTDSFKPPSTEVLPVLVSIGVLGVGLSTLFLMRSLRRLGAVRAVLLFSTASVFGLVFAHVFLDEPVTLVQALGACVMLGGMYLLNRGEKKGGASENV